jgi:hypothetical protein
MSKNNLAVEDSRALKELLQKELIECFRYILGNTRSIPLGRNMLEQEGKLILHIYVPTDSIISRGQSPDDLINLFKRAANRLAWSIGYEVKSPIWYEEGGRLNGYISVNASMKDLEKMKRLRALIEFEKILSDNGVIVNDRFDYLRTFNKLEKLARNHNGEIPAKDLEEIMKRAELEHQDKGVVSKIRDSILSLYNQV